MEDRLAEDWFKEFLNSSMLLAPVVMETRGLARYAFQRFGEPFRQPPSAENTGSLRAQVENQGAADQTEAEARRDESDHHGACEDSKNSE